MARLFWHPTVPCGPALAKRWPRFTGGMRSWPEARPHPRSDARGMRPQHLTTFDASSMRSLDAVGATPRRPPRGVPPHGGGVVRPPGAVSHAMAVDRFGFQPAATQLWQRSSPGGPGSSCFCDQMRVCRTVSSQPQAARYVSRSCCRATARCQTALSPGSSIQMAANRRFPFAYDDGVSHGTCQSHRRDPGSTGIARQGCQQLAHDALERCRAVAHQPTIGVRASCCHFYRTADGERCLTCPLTAIRSVRRASAAGSMTSLPNYPSQPKETQGWSCSGVGLAHVDRWRAAFAGSLARGDAPVGEPAIGILNELEPIAERVRGVEAVDASHRVVLLDGDA